MGAEVPCRVRFGKQQSEGKALLETNEILFRGDFRLKIPLSTIQSLKAVDGELRVQTAEGLAVFHLGAAAEKWREKIIHPKSRLEKLGVKPNSKDATIAISLIRNILKADIARQIWGNDGFYPILNAEDKTILRSISLANSL